MVQIQVASTRKESGYVTEGNLKLTGFPPH